MSNLIETRNLPVFKGIERCLVQYEKDADKLLQNLRNEIAWEILGNKGSIDDYDSACAAVNKYIRQQPAKIATAVIRRDLHLAYTHALPAPVRPRHLRHKPYPRWSRQ